MNYNHSKPPVPSPSALPRFSLPNEPSEEGVDPLDVAATAQRPALDGSRARRVVRASMSLPPLPPLQADATSEVQVEDILLEVYADDPPPTRRSSGVEAPASISASIASVVPPAAEQSAAVDALLRDPAFGYAPADHESPSVAPVAFPSMSLSLAEPPATLARPLVAPASGSPGVPRRSRAATAMWTVLLLVVVVGGGAGSVLGVRNGTYARLRDSAKAAAARARSKPSAPAVQPVAPAAAPVAAVAPVAVATPVAPVAAAPAVPNVSVDSLPQSAIPADSSLVTFPASAQGRRVFFDGRLLAVTSTPMQLRCGRHMIRIGATGKARVTDLACGREVTLVR